MAATKSKILRTSSSIISKQKDHLAIRVKVVSLMISSRLVVCVWRSVVGIEVFQRCCRMSRGLVFCSFREEVIVVRVTTLKGQTFTSLKMLWLVFLV